MRGWVCKTKKTVLQKPIVLAQDNKNYSFIHQIKDKIDKKPFFVIASNFKPKC